MLPRNQPDRIRIVFDDHRLVANAGLLLPATLARHLGLRELVDHHLDLGGAPGRANTGDKLMTLVASAMAGGDCIDDADVLRTGGTACTLGGTVKAPSTLGTFLRSFRWGHVRQLDRVSRELLARAWAAGAGPGDAPFTIDLDSTICETYGLAKEGARHHGYTGKRGYHPLLAIAAGTGDVLMSRLREGRANTARGAAHFLRETVGRVRYAGANGRLTLRADSGFYTHGVVSVCRKMDVRFSITIRQHKSLHNLIEAIPEDAWTPIPYWMDGAADVAETTCTPFQSEPDAAPVRLIVRRVKPTPGSQLALFATYSYHGFITDRDGEMLELEADHRRHAEIENAIRDLKHGVGLNHLPSGRFAANAAWLAVQVMAHNIARWTARIGLGEQVVTTKTLRRRFFSLAGRITRSHCICHSAGLGKPSSIVPWPDCAPCHSLPDGGGGNRPPSGQPNVPANSRHQADGHPPARRHSHPFGGFLNMSPWPDGSTRPRREPPHTASATALALGSPVRSCPGPIARPATPCLTAAAATGRHPANRTSPRTGQSGLRVPLAVSSPRYLALTNIRRRSQSLPAATEDKHRPPSTPNRARTIALPCPYRPFRCCIVIPSVDLG